MLHPVHVFLPTTVRASQAAACGIRVHAEVSHVGAHPILCRETVPQGTDIPSPDTAKALYEAAGVEALHPRKSYLGRRWWCFHLRTRDGARRRRGGGTSWSSSVSPKLHSPVKGGPEGLHLALQGPFLTTQFPQNFPSFQDKPGETLAKPWNEAFQFRLSLGSEALQKIGPRNNPVFQIISHIFFVSFGNGPDQDGRRRSLCQSCPLPWRTRSGGGATRVPSMKMKTMIFAPSTSGTPSCAD